MQRVSVNLPACFKNPVGIRFYAIIPQHILLEQGIYPIRYLPVGY
jgi:hypothetical protein